jgi:hypothetical protein
MDIGRTWLTVLYQEVEMGRLGRRIISANFDGGDISSEGGALLLRQVEQRIRLTKAIASVFDDRRRGASVTHGVRDLLAQRIYGLCCGWEDVSAHNVLRRDLVLQTAVGRVDELASAPTLSRLETSSTRADAAASHGVLLDQFIASKTSRPKELVLDVDATHMPLYGEQEKSHFHSYYDNCCYLPLYVFCGQDILACVLRPSYRDPASVLSAQIKLITQRLRQVWPRIRIVVRGDSGFCRPQALRRFEKRGLHYIIGLQKNAVPLRRVELAELALADRRQNTGVMQRMIGEFDYGAGSWDRERRVIARLEHDANGRNPRFIVTNLKGGRKPCTSACIALAARRRTASRRRSSICLADAQAATNSRPISYGFCWRHSPAR